MTRMVRLPVFGRLHAGARRRADDGVPEQRRALEVPWPGVVVLLALASVVLVSLGLHLWGIVGDLPYAPDVDEPVFLRAAVGMLQHRTLNPGFFGHPGSTIIYPIAGLVELWYQVAKHVPPFAHPMPGIGREFAADPMPFYVIGRLVSVAYGVGCVVATWLLARRIVGNVGGVLAALLLPATGMVVAYGHLVRTDIAGLFFALVALWLALRAMDAGRSRDWAFAAIAIGLGISTRYFYATLVVPYLVAAWLWFRSARARPEIPGRSSRAWAVPLIALLLVPVAFAITSPFVLLDLRTAVAHIRGEAGGLHPGADGLSPIGNLAWYVGEVVPATFDRILLVLAVVGSVVAARRAWRATAVLAAFATSYLVGISTAPLHWDRYVIPLVPIVGIFVAATVLAIGNLAVGTVADWRDGGRSRLSGGPGAGASGPDRPMAAGLASAIIVLLLLPSLLNVAAADGLRAAPSTRVLATEWVVGNLPPDSRIAEEMYTAYLDDAGHDLLRVFSLADRSLDAYRAAGYRFLITSSAMADRYRDAIRYPRESAFYDALEASGRLVASFAPGPDHAGPHVSIYEIAGP
jgi:Dolichyl-phosphate-mannose-protein mannosyltransferase